jgi:pimeloyl-ACP methyl ester carboxylesterase
VIALDERGHGDSTRAPIDVSREAHVADVVFVIDQLDLGPVILIGQSLGGNLAFLVAARHPDLVQGLVVAEACPEGDPEAVGPGEIREWLNRWPTPFPSLEAAARFFMGPSLSATAWAGGLERRADGWWPRFDVDVMVRTLHDATSRGYWEEWKRIRCPTLVVGAGAGLVPVAILEAMAERLPTARFVAIPRARHDLHLDRPVEWREAVTGFLKTFRLGSTRAPS